MSSNSVRSQCSNKDHSNIADEYTEMTKDMDQKKRFLLIAIVQDWNKDLASGAFNPRQSDVKRFEEIEKQLKLYHSNACASSGCSIL